MNRTKLIQQMSYLWENCKAHQNALLSLFITKVIVDGCWCSEFLLKKISFLLIYSNVYFPSVCNWLSSQWTIVSFSSLCWCVFSLDFLTSKIQTFSHVENKNLMKMPKKKSIPNTQMILTGKSRIQHLFLWTQFLCEHCEYISISMVLHTLNTNYYYWSKKKILYCRLNKEKKRKTCTHIHRHTFTVRRK